MKYVIPIVVIVLALVAANGVYVVAEGHAAMLTRMGQLEASGIGPGLHFKLPFIEDVTLYDTRAILLQSEPHDYETRDGDAVRVGAFVRWRVADPRVWFEATTGDTLQLDQQMTPLIRTALRREIARHSLDELLVADGGAIDEAVGAAVSGELRKRLGVEVLAIGVERVLPPEDALDSVYKRMTAEADARAAAIREQGQADAAAIHAEGDAAHRKVVAAAATAAAKVRGRGDAEAASIYAAASTRDPQFFRYWSSLEAWRRSFDDGGAVVVLDRDSPFMRAVDEGAGAR